MGSDRITLDIEKREVSGKKVAVLRKQGIVPAVVYGADYDATSVQAPAIRLQKVVREAGTHTPIELTLGGKTQTAIIKDVEIDHVHNRIQHVSFQAVSKNEIITTKVPVVITDEDESPAKRAGLIVLQAVEELEVKAKPGDLPESLEVSAKELAEHGDKLLVSDIVLPKNVELLEEEEDLTIASVYEPSALQAANEAADQENEVTDEAAEEVPAENGSEKSTE